jgi:hypothetical protein
LPPPRKKKFDKWQVIVSFNGSTIKAGSGFTGILAFVAKVSSRHKKIFALKLKFQLLTHRIIKTIEALEAV